MSGFEEVARTSLQDDKGGTLDLIIEVCGPYAHLFAEYRANPDDKPIKSVRWTFTKLERAEEARDKKVEEALAKGWRVG